MVAMVANSAEEAKIYIDFFRETTNMPFGIDMWVAEKRAEATEYVAKLGLQDKFLYNSITPWDKDIKGQVHKLKDLGIKHVVVQAFDDAGPDPRAGRLNSLEKILAQGADGFETVIVDTSVMNLPCHVVLARRQPDDQGEARTSLRRRLLERHAHVEGSEDHLEP